MKKTFFLGILFVLMASMVFAAGENSAGGTPTDTESDVVNTGLTDVRGGGSDMSNGSSGEAGQGSAVTTNTATQQQNAGEATQIKNEVKTQEKLQAGEYATADGKQVKVQTESNNQMKLNVGTATASTKMQMTQEQTAEGTKLSVALSNGKNAEVKVMPDTASEKAMEQLKLNACSEESGCSIELKEVGSGTETKAAYEVQAKKDAKFLGLFKTQIKVQAQVDAETGEVIRTQKSWWSFLATQ
jgi:hypothetical protein